jgi:phage tail tape-measure protein
MGVGCTVVASVLVLNAVAVGSAVGEIDGETEGATVGSAVGEIDGEAVGVAVGSTEGEVDGEAVGMAVSAGVGCFVVASVLEGNDKENEYE